MFNSIQGEDLSGEFTAGDQPSAATPIISTTSSQPAGTTNNAYNNVDNSLLIEALEDITAPIDSEAVKDFGDIDFGTIDQDQGHIDGNGDPFGDHNNSGFDDFFNS